MSKKAIYSAAVAKTVTRGRKATSHGSYRAKRKPNSPRVGK